MLLRYDRRRVLDPRGTEATKLRVELWIEGALVLSAGVPSLGGDVLREVSWEVDAHRGKFATLVLVDEATTKTDRPRLPHRAPRRWEISLALGFWDREDLAPWQR